VSNAFTAARVVTPGRPTWGRAVRADGSVIEDYAAGRNGYAPDGVTPMAGEVYDIATPGGVIEAGTVIDGVSMVLTEPASLG
jgi:hypothetical protein